MNDFSRASDLLFSIMFADDTSVFIEGHSFNEVIESLNTELKKVSFWLQSNKLTLNVKKSHYMVFHRSRIKHNQTAIKIQNCTINKTDSIKFLGVIIDNKLNWHEHIIYIKNKISKSIGIIYKVRKYVEKQTIKNMYYTFVFPYLIYCNEIWGNACQAYVDPLIKLTPACTWWNRPEEDLSSGKSESTHPSRTVVKSIEVFYGVESVVRGNADSLLN